MKAGTAEKRDIVELRPSDRTYPERVLELPGQPRIIRVIGNLEVLDMGPALAVVGTRNPTEDILKSTRRIVDVSTEFEMVIVSGLSPGVDVAAHEAALEAGLRTIAVPGSGLESLFESDRAELAGRIVDAGGLLVSPFPNNAPETQERRWWRNRVIAALCHGLVMVASEPDGGALEAQRWAGRLERRLIEPDDED
jgi:DNA processing protein